MKIFAISDLHLSFSTDKPMDIFGGEWNDYENKILNNCKELISDDDVLLIAGDISWAMNYSEVKEDLKYLEKLPGSKVIIKGNHDYWWQSIGNVREFMGDNVYAVQNDSLRLENAIVCGTRGWIIPEQGKTLSKEDDKIYKRELLRLEMSLENMSKIRKEGDYVICMLHFPPFNSTRTESDFTVLIEKYNVDAVVYGHIHGKKDNRGNKTFINKIPYFLTSCDQVNNIPTLIYKA